MGKTDLELALAKARVVLQRGFQLRIGEAACLVHAAERLLDAEAGGGEIGILGTDATPNAGKRDNCGGFRTERMDRGGESQHGH